MTLNNALFSSRGSYSDNRYMLYARTSSSLQYYYSIAHSPRRKRMIYKHKTLLFSRSRSSLEYRRWVNCWTLLVHLLIDLSPLLNGNILVCLLIIVTISVNTAEILLILCYGRHRLSNIVSDSDWPFADYVRNHRIAWALPPGSCSL